MSTISKKQLVNLSKEEKLRLLDAIKEKKRRKRAEKPPYIPNLGQASFHKSNKRERYVFSGNGSGKTTALVNEIYWAATGYNPILKEYSKVPAKIICLLDDPDKIALKVIPEMRKWFEVKDDWCQKEGKPHISRIVFPNGSFVKFLSHGIEPMKAESIELDYLFCDEPPPYHLYSALTRGMREKGSKKRTLIVGTPLAAPWLRVKIYDEWAKGELPHVDCFKLNSEVNKDNLDWEEQQRYFASLSEKERKVRQEGSFFDLSGLALAELFSRKKHLVKPIDWPRNWPCVVAIDPAQSKPHVACLVGINHKEELFYLKEISLRAPARQFAKALKKWYNGYPVVDIVCDSLGNSGMSGGEGLASFIDVLNDEGVRARPTSYEDKDDERWIQAIQEVLYVDENKEGAVPKLRIVGTNTGIISDIENVQWTKVKNMDIYKPKLDISKKDYLACLKYALAANLVYSKRKARVHRAEFVGWRERQIDL